VTISFPGRPSEAFVEGRQQAFVEANEESLVESWMGEGLTRVSPFMRAVGRWTGRSIF
jgi:hypothetical protein